MFDVVICTYIKICNQVKRHPPPIGDIVGYQIKLDLLKTMSGCLGMFKK